MTNVCRSSVSKVFWISSSRCHLYQLFICITKRAVSQKSKRDTVTKISLQVKTRDLRRTLAQMCDKTDEWAGRIELILDFQIRST